MLPVIVRVENLEMNTSVQHVFRRSPVHVGRNKLNELPLANGFVSLWHGILRFGENTVEYLDLDSTNGTEVDGKRVRRNVFVPVSEQTDLRIGPLRLHFSRSEVAPAEPKIDQTHFGRSISSHNMASRSPAASVGTLFFKQAAAGRAPVSPLVARASSDDQSPEAIASSLFLFCENYREAWRTLHAQLTGKLGPLPEDTRAATLQLLQQRFPALEQEEQFRALGGAVSIKLPPPAPEAPGAPRPEVPAAPSPGSLTWWREWAGPGSAGTPPPRVQLEGMMAEGAIQTETDGLYRAQLDQLGTKFVRTDTTGSSPEGASPARVPAVVAQSAPQSPIEALIPSLDRRGSSTLLSIFAQTYSSESAKLETAEDVEQFLHQLAAVLEAFGKAFLELRRGHDQFGKEIAVPLIGDQTPLRHAKTPRDLLRYLLDCDGKGADRIRSLTEGFADVMIHQVALLNGIRQGISALLTHLSPDELRRSSALSRSGVGSMLLKVPPVRAMALWGPYVARHQELLQEEREVQSIVFGSEFAFAYAQIVGGNVKSPPRKDGPTNGGPARRADS